MGRGSYSSGGSLDSRLETERRLCRVRLEYGVRRKSLQFPSPSQTPQLKRGCIQESCGGTPALDDPALVLPCSCGKGT
ncbi:hypothetical protein B0H12DRAFT_1126958 [Mycena haematopus]|nr:hypothetical protein B0H12DRAFT_1126958 [Mycena haematopus]